MRSALVPFIGLMMSGCALASHPKQWSDVALATNGCEERLWHHTYRAEQRLTTIAQCITTTGIVRNVHQAGDGDLIIELETDVRLVNSTNVHGWLKIEAVCQKTGAKSKHRNACRGYTGPWFPHPPVGSTVRVTGRYVSDRKHGGWMEIHPLSRLEILQQ